MQLFEGPHDQVRAVPRNLQSGVDREGAGLPDIDLEVERERGGQDVEAGAEVRAGRRDADQATSLHHRRPPEFRPRETPSGIGASRFHLIADPGSFAPAKLPMESAPADSTSSPTPGVSPPRNSQWNRRQPIP